MASSLTRGLMPPDQMARVKVFIGSSTKAIPFALALQQNIESVRDSDNRRLFEVTVWSQNFYPPGKSTLETLEERSSEFDFAVLIFNADDIISSKRKSYVVARDNVVFELGLFVARLGTDRSFFVIPESVTNFHVPSDLAGITYCTFDNEREDQVWTAARLQAASNKITEQMRALGPLKKRRTFEGKVDQLLALVQSLVTEANTKSIGSFPGYLEDHILPLLENADRLWISCDVLDYALFSKQSLCRRYRDIIREKKANVLVLNGDDLKKMIEAQIPRETWKSRYANEQEFVARVRDLEEFMSSTTIESVDEFYDSIIEHQNKQIELAKGRWKKNRQSMCVKRLKQPISIYMWVADDAKAVFSIPSFKPKGFESGFTTRDQSLAKALHSIWEYYQSFSD